MICLVIVSRCKSQNEIITDSNCKLNSYAKREFQFKPGNPSGSAITLLYTQIQNVRTKARSETCRYVTATNNCIAVFVFVE